MSSTDVNPRLGVITGPSRDAVVDDFLESHVPVATATEFWGTTMQLAASAYITTKRPPHFS